MCWQWRFCKAAVRVQHFCDGSGSDSLRLGTVYRIWAGCYPAFRFSAVCWGVRSLGARHAPRHRSSLSCRSATMVSPTSLNRNREAVFAVLAIAQGNPIACILGPPCCDISTGASHTFRSDRIPLVESRSQRLARRKCCLESNRRRKIIDWRDCRAVIDQKNTGCTLSQLDTAWIPPLPAPRRSRING